MCISRSDIQCNDGVVCANQKEVLGSFSLFETGQVGLGVGSCASNRTNAGSPPSEFDYT